MRTLTYWHGRTDCRRMRDEEMRPRKTYTTEEWEALAEELKGLESKQGKTQKERTRGKYIRKLFRAHIEEVPKELKKAAEPRMHGFKSKAHDWNQLAAEMADLERMKRKSNRDRYRLIYLRRLFRLNPPERRGGLLNRAVASRLAFEEEKKKYNLKFDMNPKQFEAYKRLRKGYERYLKRLKAMMEMEKILEETMWEEERDEEMD